MSATLHLPYEVVVPHTCLLGEGPVWDATTKSICWVDILNGIVHEYVAGKKEHRTLPVNDMVGAIALCTNGNFLAGLKSGLAFINRESGAIKKLHQPEAHLPGNRFNDGKCDPAGRFWIGTMALSEESGAGNVYRIDKDFSCTKIIAGVAVSNGMAWSADGKLFYYIDSPTREVVAYDFDMATGDIKNKRVVISVPKEEGFPDGMTIDSDGMLWIGHWDGWQVARWNPFTGEKLCSIPMPAARITSCTFGGDYLQDLYITSARVGLTAGQLDHQPLAGSLFIIKNSGFKGVETSTFELQEW